MTALVSLSNHRPWLLGAIAVLGTALSLSTWYSLNRGEEERIHASFQRRAEAQVRIAQQRIRLYEEMVHGLANLFAGSELVTRAEFEQTAADLLSRHQGVQALEWVAYVRREQRAAFEEAARREYPGFAITEPDGKGGLVPARDHPDHTVIRLLVPLAGNEPALGYDNSRSPIGADLQAARREQQLRVTHQFRLAQSRSDDDEYGIVFALPVFHPVGSGPGDDGFRGFVQGVFRIETMLAQTHRLQADEAIFVQYRDLEATDRERVLLYSNRAGREERPARSRLLSPAPDRAFREEIRLGGRRWEFVAEMNPQWWRRQHTITPWLSLGGGLLTTGVVLLLVNLLLRRTEEIEKQVALRTAELEGTKRELQDDIIRRREAETALHASEQRLEAIIDNSPATIFVKDLAGRYVLCNRGFERVCGRPRADILGRTDADLFPPERAAAFAEHDRHTLAAGAAHSYDEFTVDRLGRRTALVQKFPLRDAQGRIYALCGIATDITERVAAEQERIEFERKLQQTQRLESLGVLAGGIAHDFNNILTAVLGNASLARHLLPPGSTVLPQIEQIEHAARRAADLCGQMLAYAGKRKLSPGRLDLSDLVRDTAALLEVSVTKSARLHLDLARELPPVEADATQLRQIVMNLVINAADALGDSVGDIHVATSLTEAGPELFRDAVENPDLPGGRYVTLEVRDTGCGMPPEMLARIFEPFFTTKFAGRGLGLSAVLGIVRSHRGALFVESTVGVGTRFRLFLPAVAGAAIDAPAPAAREGMDAGLPSLRGTVLLVDDEAHVREIAALALRQCGLTVLEAPHGAAALALCAEHGAGLDLILLDLTMPGLSGEETLRRLRQQGATQKVILMSGYSENDATRRCLELGAVAFLPKPFELAALLHLIAAHLPADATRPA